MWEVVSAQGWSGQAAVPSLHHVFPGGRGTPSSAAWALQQTPWTRAHQAPLSMGLQSLTRLSD